MKNDTAFVRNSGISKGDIITQNSEMYINKVKNTDKSKLAIGVMRDNVWNL